MKRKFGLILFSIFFLTIVITLANKNPPGGSPHKALALIQPAIIARAESGFMDSPGLDNEAGISAYFQASGPINLAGNQLRNTFRTIETDTDDYLIGFIPVPDYGENEDVKVYVNKNGWVMAYYLARDPVSKIFDFNGTNTRLESVLLLVSTAIWEPNPNIAFYDFRYPNANKLLLIGETRSSESGTDSFDVNLPSDIPVYEISWYLKGGHSSAEFILDGMLLGQSTGNPIYDFIPTSKFVPDSLHTIGIHNQLTYFGDVFGGLAIVYEEIP